MPLLPYDYLHLANCPEGVTISDNFCKEITKTNLNDQVRLRDDNQKGDVGPGEEGELPHVVPLHQGEHEPHEPDDVPVDQMKWVQ